MLRFKAEKKRLTTDTNSKIILPSILLKLPKLKLSRNNLLPIVIGTILVLFLIGSVFFVIKNKTFTVRVVRCSVGNSACSSELTAIANELINQNLFALNEKTVIQKSLFLHPEIESVMVKRQLPSTLNVSYKARTPIAVVEDKLGKMYLIDKLFKIYGDGSTVPLVHIKTTEAVAVGETTVSPTLLMAVHLMQLLQQSSVPMNRISIDSADDVVVHLNSDLSIHFSAERDVAKQVDSLQYILGNSKIDSDKISLIDVRFDNPVVK